jgi:transglutaminase-like putative cysteine protease
VVKTEPPSAGWTLVGHLQQVVAEADRSGAEYVLPTKHRVTYSLTVPANTVGMKAGAVVRVWLPFPVEHERQRGVKLISASPEGAVIAPADAPQRTIYFECKVVDPGKQMVFSEVMEFTSLAYYPKLDEERALPLSASFAGGYLNERAPHIVFTPPLRKIVAEAVGDESNPLIRARRLYRWVTDHIAYDAEEEYCVIPSFTAKALATHRGDCGVQSMLFITLCRYAGIPARWQSGWETKPVGWDMHDWAEFYVEPWGWLPADPSYGLQKSEDPRVREFYFGHQDSYRMIVNRDYGSELHPAKRSLRSEPADFQRGEVEIDGKNLYFNQWDYDVKFESK